MALGRFALLDVLDVLKAADVGDRVPTVGVLTRHARELHRRTQGHIGSLTTLVEHACHLAIATGAEDITTDILQRAATDNAADTSAASISSAAAG